MNFYFQLALWGNRNDLSVSAGNLTSTLSDILEDSKQLEKNILVNDSNEIFEYVSSLKDRGDVGELTIVMDNCGLELVADLCLAIFCISHNLFNRVVFHVKKFPWFVSDVTSSDFHWTINQMKSEESNSALRDIAVKSQVYLDSNQFALAEENYWTTPLPFCKMNEADESLYKQLSQSKLIIFKGDLNYRKLGADLSWDPTTSFKTFLQNFHPSPLVALRTVKSEIICNLSSGKAEELKKLNEEWMELGEYGVVQFFMC